MQLHLIRRRPTALSRKSFSTHLLSCKKQKMNRAVTVTILIFLLCAFSTQGIPILGTQGRCKCIRTTSAVIHPKLIQSLRYIPSGAQCEAMEIIITLKNKKKVCVDPGAKWLRVLISALKGARHSN